MASASCSLLYIRDHFLECSVNDARGAHILGQHVYHGAQVFGSLWARLAGEVSRTPRDGGVHEFLRERSTSLVMQKAPG